ncbi:hypothetical protein [Parabacteroides provencensis]|uniref:hypothetical protein n=1 Tax=Parabacteroides provencensis TaxID=1944636 RepID=UPI000C1505FB|nr:hypothetical protein [Parabacteroides provencensis]
MEKGTSTITTPFTSEEGGFKYEYQATHQPNSKPSFINYSVTKDNARVASGNIRTAENYFTFETQAPLTDAERNMIYAKVSADKADVIALAEKITISTVQ